MRALITGEASCASRAERQTAKGPVHGYPRGYLCYLRSYTPGGTSKMNRHVSGFVERPVRISSHVLNSRSEKVPQGEARIPARAGCAPPSPTLWRMPPVTRWSSRSAPSTGPRTQGWLPGLPDGTGTARPSRSLHEAGARNQDEHPPARRGQHETRHSATSGLTNQPCSRRPCRVARRIRMVRLAGRAGATCRALTAELGRQHASWRQRPAGCGTVRSPRRAENGSIA